jgi:hypothetical protein
MLTPAQGISINTLRRNKLIAKKHQFHPRLKLGNNIAFDQCFAEKEY